MAKLVIIRGLPGSGKSTLARKLRDEKHYLHYEADMYFYNEDGEYVFDPNKIRSAHRWCQDVVRFGLVEGFNVVVSNTFTQKWEVQPYLDMANALGAEVEVTVATGNYENIHGVPEDKMEKMKQRWEDF